MFFKLLATLAGIVLIISTLFTAYYGRRCAKHRREGFLGDLENHENHAKLLCWVTCGAIVLIELMVRFHGGLHLNPIFPTHLLFAIPFFASLVAMRFWATGLKDPRFHRLLALICLANFLGTITTGAILLYGC